MSISTPAIGLPALSTYCALTNIGSPGVGERTIEPPFSVGGECMRQNGPSRLASVSPPLSPLLSMTMSCEKPSEPEISTASLWVSFEACPILTM